MKKVICRVIWCIVLGGLLVLGIVLWLSSAHIGGKIVGTLALLWLIMWTFIGMTTENSDGGRSFEEITQSWRDMGW